MKKKTLGEGYQRFEKGRKPLLWTAANGIDVRIRSDSQITTEFTAIKFDKTIVERNSTGKQSVR